VPKDEKKDSSVAKGDVVTAVQENPCKGKKKGSALGGRKRTYDREEDMPDGKGQHINVRGIREGPQSHPS